LSAKKVVKKSATIGTGLLLKRLINWPFDYLLYPFVLVALGHWWGGLLLTGLSLLYSFLTIKIYDWAKCDLLGIEAAKKVMEEWPNSQNRVKRYISTNLNKRRVRVLAFFALCFDDPVTVTLCLRGGNYQFSGLSRQDWKIFLAATLVANLYWIVGWVTVIEFFRRIFL